MVLHIEGAEAITEDFSSLEMLYRRGLRSIGPVWSRNNRFAKGVPFSFPGSPDQGGGLSGAGKELIQICNNNGNLLDLSHLNEKGFRDIAKLSQHPLVATHSNAHALAPKSAQPHRPAAGRHRKEQGRCRAQRCLRIFAQRWFAPE